jgi:serine protease
MKDGASAANPTLAREYVASYSNAGPGLTLVAPGGDPSQSELSGATSDDPLHWIDNLYTTTAANPSLRCPNPADCTALFSGTSQATPHVSAAAALMLSLVPNLTPSEIRQILIATADDIGDPNQGHGRLDIYRALAAVAGDPNPPAGPWPANFVAIAYVPGGTNRPQIVDATYPAGVPVKNGGTFRIADVPASVKSYKIGVWYDANGDGVVDAGDYFGSSGTCTTAAPCPGVAGGIDAVPVSSGFVLN